jgi:hypothetical protein
MDNPMATERQKLRQKREPRRRRLNQSAWITIDGGATNRECLVSDVSQNGAKIILDGATDIRGKFGLALVPNHPRRQQCEVVWRRGKILGIRFVR